MLDSSVEEIKSRLNVTEVLADYIQLRKAGVNYKAVCPFHSEKTPSFVVSPTKQIWHCFGCGLGGDIFEFVKQIENVEFAQALRILADRAGVELKKPTVTELQVMDKKNLLVEINDMAASYYQKVLWTSNAGKDALDYLRKRGLTDVTIKNWRLGFAPDDFHYVENFLAKRFKKPDIALAGLIINKDNESSYFDRFRGRIMFPIADTHGDVVGFTGRILAEKENTGKYVNSPETPVYNKSDVIYGFHQAKNQIRKENRAILVEGNMDVISCHQAGFNQSVASSGTAITMRQLTSLKRICENLVFAFDSDTAGNAATVRALEEALSMGFNVKIVDLGGAKDPDELIKKGIGIWKKAVDSAPHYVEYFYNYLFKNYDPDSVDGKRRITKELAPLIYRISDTVTKAHFVRKLSMGINIQEQTIWDLINKINLPKVQVKQDKPVVKKERKTILEEHLLGLILNVGASDVLAEYAPADFDEANREVFRAVAAKAKFKAEALKKDFPHLITQLDLLSFAAAVEIQEQRLDVKVELLKVEQELRKLVLKRKMEALSSQMAEAERLKDQERLKVLGTEFAVLSGKMAQIK
jgi:DNA primase